jgi:hypothetical protein
MIEVLPYMVKRVRDGVEVFARRIPRTQGVSVIVTWTEHKRSGSLFSTPEAHALAERFPTSTRIISQR